MLNLRATIKTQINIKTKLIAAFSFTFLLTAAGCTPKPEITAEPPKDKDSSLNILSLGDSYTIGHGGSAADRWPVLLASTMRDAGFAVNEPTIVAATAWSTEDLLSTLQSIRLAGPFDIVTLMIGVNNQYRGESVRQYSRVLIELLQSSVALAGGDPGKVWLLSIPDWALSPFGKGSEPQHNGGIDDFNKAAKSAAEQAGVNWLDISPHIQAAQGKPEYFVKDGLHYSRKMHALWAADLVAVVRQAHHGR